MTKLPTLNKELSKDQLLFLQTFAKSVRHSVLAMTTNAGSGHPGGSLGCADYLTLLYTAIISRTGEPVVVSNGHISPAVYGVLAEMGYVNKEDAVKNFRKAGAPFEGHVTRHVPGVWYGTGPLGAGAGAASGFALANKIKKEKTKVYCLIGDGEAEEGQIYEMMNFAAKYKLDNLIVFMDYNEVQLTAGLKEIMPYHPKEIFKAGGWEIIDVQGHDFQDMWQALSRAQSVKNKPVLLFGHTIMGRGVDFMESEGKAKKSTWHGKAAKPEEAAAALKKLTLTKEEEKLLADFRNKQVKWIPEKAKFGRKLTKMKIVVGKPRVYEAGTSEACRNAYGAALLDLAKENKNIIALTADLSGSVKTDMMGKEFPDRHFDAGVAEQQMVSCSGGLSLSGIIPFCSTFGAFLTSRAKDQARVNDINECNVKMVATHCGLSVGEDGPTHQAIDDSGSVLGFFHTMQVEPADANHCDRLIRFIATHYGNFYLRMGRHNLPVLTKEDGSLLFDKKYEYYYGRCDILRAGTQVTIAAMGSVAAEALLAWKELKALGISAEVVIASSIKEFDETILDSVKKTKKVVTVEDHNVLSGLGSQLARYLTEQGVPIDKFEMLGVKEYQLSGKPQELYKAAGLDARAIVEAVKKVI